jgi:hypothetical protein
MATTTCTATGVTEYVVEYRRYAERVPRYVGHPPHWSAPSG